MDCFRGWYAYYFLEIHWILLKTKMFNVVPTNPRYHPIQEISSGCALTQAHASFNRPLGFSLDEKSCRRAGLDYKDLAVVKKWACLMTI